MLSSQCPDVLWINLLSILQGPCCHWPSYISHLGSSVVSQLLTSYLSPSYSSSFSDEPQIGYKRQRTAYVTLLFKNINLYISSLIKSKLPSLTFETRIVQYWHMFLWGLLPIFVRLLQTVHCASLPLVLSSQVGIFSLPSTPSFYWV